MAEEKRQKMSNALDRLKEKTVVVADTGDIQGMICSLNFTNKFYDNLKVFSLVLNF